MIEFKVLTREQFTERYPNARTGMYDPSVITGEVNIPRVGWRGCLIGSGMTAYPIQVWNDDEGWVGCPYAGSVYERIT